MKRITSARLVLSVAVVAAWALGDAAPARAYVEAPMSLGAVLAQSSHVMVLTVTAVDKQKNAIVFRKVQDLKGKHPTDTVKHMIGKAGLRPGEWKEIMDWAEPGKTAVFFHNGGAGECCINNNWYQIYPRGEWWEMSHGEPFLLRSYCGKPEKLIGIVNELVAGREVIVPCMVDGNKEDLHAKRARVQRLKASLKLLDYNPKRDFAGLGGEDVRRLAGMPGFSHYAALTRVDAEAQAISCVDFDGDGKLDICLAGSGRVVLLQNQGDSFGEAHLPGLTGGCRSAVWADYNGDGKPDLLLATPTGPKLYTNLGGGQFRDDSALLPRENAYNLTAAAWLDADGDGRPDILLANGFHGLRLYRNKRPADADPKKPLPKPPEPWFEDVSAAWGLGPDGPVGLAKGDTLAVADVNGDGRPDFLYGAGEGMLFLNTGKKFETSAESGIAYKPGKVGPVFGDFNNDGFPDLFVPQPDGRCKLFRNDGKGRFADVTAGAGDLGKSAGHAVCAAWGDFDNDGHLDLVVGCLRGTNRYYHNNGDGTFTDRSAEIGLTQRFFNSQAVALADLNNDGKLDLILNNEGQESALLLGNAQLPNKRTPVALLLPGDVSYVGAKVRVLGKDGKPVAASEVCGGEGRGGQRAPTPRFALAPGAYRLELCDSTGKKRAKEITVAEAPLRVRFDGAASSADGGGR